MNDKNQKKIIGFKISDGSIVTADDLIKNPELKNMVIHAADIKGCFYDSRISPSIFF